MKKRFVLFIATILSGIIFFPNNIYCQDSLMILMDKNLKMAHIIQLENKQNLYGPASLKTSQFNTKNPYIKYAEEAILNSPYYPYTSNPTKFLYATRFLRIFYFDLD